MASDDSAAAKDYMPTSAGIRLGAEGDEVRRLQAYLERFGYLKSAQPAAFGPLMAVSRAPKATPERFDDATACALRRFQQFAGLPVTGELDDATVALMSTPRCGFPDLPRGNQLVTERGPGGEQIANFVAQGNRWSNTNLTYHFQNFTNDLTEPQIRTALRQAMQLWADVTPLTFTESTSTSADMIIRFVVGDHGDGSPFDGPSGVLAHGFFPPPNGGAIAGDLHFDDAETWSVTVPVPAGAFDLVTVAAHEFGHTLGLNHSTVAGSLMFPFYGGPHRFLSPDDRLGIQSIYGARIRPVPGWFGAEDQGADVAVADITANGRPDLIVFHVDNPGGDNHGYYRVGFNLGAAGDVTGGWSPVKPVPGWFGWENQGAGIAAADVSGNGRPDLVVFHVDNPGGENHGYYRIGFNLDASGNVTGGWSAVMPVPGWFGWENQGAGIAVADIDRNGSLDLLVFHIDNPAGENHGYYRIGRALNTGGAVTGGWGPVTAVVGWFGAEDQGAGVALGDVNGNGLQDLVVFHVDNPGGENHGYYRVIHDL